MKTPANILISTTIPDKPNNPDKLGASRSADSLVNTRTEHILWSVQLVIEAMMHYYPEK